MSSPTSQSPMAQALDQLRDGQSLSSQQMDDVIGSMLHGQCATEDMHALLVALQRKGETVDELVGAARAMRRSMLRIHSSFPVILDTCGTGGDGSQTFNISTAAAIVIAAAGIPVAKHGNRKITSSTGSADVLAELGINLDAPREIVERCLIELGICFCFAPRFHPAMKHVAEVRKQITGATIFNRLGPLCNPAAANRQVLGVGSADLQLKLASALSQLGTECSIVVRGSDGVDEVSLEASTSVVMVVGQQMRSFTWNPEEFGATRTPRAGLFADSPASSAACIREALSGRPGPCRDAVLVNAAAGLWLARLKTDSAMNPSQSAAESLSQALASAADAIDSGKARELITELGKLSQVQPNV